MGGAENEECFFADMSVREHFDFYIAAGLERMDAVKAVARDRGASKNEIYRQLL